MYTLYVVFVTTFIFSSCSSMEQKQKIVRLHHLQQEKKGDLLKQLNFKDELEQPHVFLFREKQIILERDTQPLRETFIIKDELPASQGFWGYLWSKAPSMPSISEWFTQNSDWRNPLVIKNEDYPEIRDWYCFKDKYVVLRGSGMFVLFDVKTGKKIIDFRESQSVPIPLDRYNAQMTYGALELDKKAHLYDLVKHEKMWTISFEQSARFMHSTSTDNHFVALNNDNLVVYDLAQNSHHTVKLPGTVAQWKWMDEPRAHALVIECKDGAVYLINPRDDYKATEIEYENHFETPDVLLKKRGSPYFVARVDDEIRLYNALTCKQEYAGIVERGDILENIMHMSDDNRYFATKTMGCTRGKGILLYNTNSKEPLFIDLTGDSRSVQILSPFSHDSNYFAYALYDNDKPGQTWRFHNIQNGAMHEVDIAFASGSIGWIPQSPLFVHHLTNTALFFYDAKTTGSVTFEFKESKSRWMNDSLVLTFKSDEPEGSFFTVKDDKLIHQGFATEDHFTLVGSAFNQDGTRFALATEKKIYIYNVATGKFIATFAQEPGNKMQSCDFSSSDYFTILGSETVRVYDQKNNYALLHTLPFKREGIKDGQFNDEKTIFGVRTQYSLNFYYMHSGN